MCIHSDKQRNNDLSSEPAASLKERGPDFFPGCPGKRGGIKWRTAQSTYTASTVQGVQ